MSGGVVLMYHIVDEPRNTKERRFCCRPADFRRQMRYLRRSRYRVVSVGELLKAIETGVPEPRDMVAVTFDDGFACLVKHALPLLTEYKIPATAFVVSYRVGGTNEWMSKRGFPERNLITHGDLLALAEAGLTIGSHTCTHPRMTEVEETIQQRELLESKLTLEDILGRPVEYFAYPYGDYDDAVRDRVEAVGYRAACSTRAGFNRHGEDPFALRRIEVYGTDSFAQFRNKILFGANDMPWTFPLKYYASRAASRFRTRQ